MRKGGPQLVDVIVADGRVLSVLLRILVGEAGVSEAIDETTKSILIIINYWFNSM